jgi:hypothetical protein
MSTLQEQINNIKKKLKKEEKKIKKEEERINNLKINGYSKLKELNIKADEYIELTVSKTIFHTAPLELIYDLFLIQQHTTPRFELIYDLFLIQQEKINFLEERIKQIEISK